MYSANIFISQCIILFIVSNFHPNLHCHLICRRPRRCWCCCCFLLLSFLDASSHLHKKVCPSVRPSIRPFVYNAFFEPSKTPILATEMDGIELMVRRGGGGDRGAVVTGGDNGCGRIWRLVTKLVMVRNKMKSTHSIHGHRSLSLGSERMSAAERVSTAKRAEGSKGMSKRCERTSTRTRKRSSTCVNFIVILPTVRGDGCRLAASDA